MGKIYLSAFCAGFDDFDHFRELLRALEPVSLGVELAADRPTPDYDRLLDRQASAFRDLPVTIHAPFLETCTRPGSAEEALMWERFSRALHVCSLFGARSMVMHTHEKSFSPAEVPEARQRSRQVICTAAEKARAQAVGLTVENVGYPAKGNVLFGFEDYIQLFEHLPEEVGALVDTGHAMANGWDIPALAAALGKRIKGYHLHNTDGTHDLHRPLYEQGLHYSGEDADNLLRVIERHTPEADLILEYAPGPHITKELLRGEIARIIAVTKN